MPITRDHTTRMDSLRGSAAVAATAAVAGAAVQNVHAAGSDQLKVGLVGCGGRGSVDAKACTSAAPGVVLWAMADLFKDQIDRMRAALKTSLGAKMDVTDERCFSGFDNCAKLLASGVDLVLLCEPPGFRPMHIKLVIDAGKHCFAQKPVCVDPVGARSVVASAEAATQKKLSLFAGTQTRHHPAYIEAIKRIQDGQIGKIRAAQCYFNTGTLWYHEPKAGWTEMENQCRNWYYYTWLSGDHIVEQHIHNIDRMNWAMGATPTKCVATGGRQVRTDPKWGDIYDHFAVEYEYPPDGVRVASYCSQFAGQAAHRVADYVVGADGICDLSGSITGKKPWKFEGEAKDANVLEHADLIAGIRSGNPINHGKRIAESSLTAVMGRMAAYTGRELNFSWVMNASQLNLFPEKLAFGPHPVDPVAKPGETVLEGLPAPEPKKAGGGGGKKAAGKK